MNLGRLMKNLEKLVVDNSPAILTAIGITGTLTTAYLTGKAAFRVGMDASTQWHEHRDSLETRDLVKVYWKEFIPPAVSGTLTVAAIVSANHVSSRRAAAMATAYSLTEKAFSEYKEKVIEKVGQNKERAIRDEIAQDRVKRNPVSENSVIITDGGDVLCYDHYTGRYFKSSMETLKKAENEINYQLLHNCYASLSDFYDLIGLPPTRVSEEVGWNSDSLLVLSYSTVLSEDNRPCIAVDFRVVPSRGFQKLGG